MIRLGVNVDHVASLRQARRTVYPDPLEAAKAAVRGGADQIVIHLREDRRHIQDSDVERMRAALDRPLNLEMAAAEEIVSIACRIRPHTATLVPERREELTTEGGLDVAASSSSLTGTVDRLRDSGIAVSLFIDPVPGQVEASVAIGADTIELHTGAYCNAADEAQASQELARLIEVARLASNKGIKVAAGHGLNYLNTTRVVQALPEVTEYNIGHAIVARSVFVGMEEAVREMKALLDLRPEDEKGANPKS